MASRQSASARKGEQGQRRRRRTFEGVGSLQPYLPIAPMQFWLVIVRPARTQLCVSRVPFISIEGATKQGLSLEEM